MSVSESESDSESEGAFRAPVCLRCIWVYLKYGLFRLAEEPTSESKYSLKGVIGNDCVARKRLDFYDANISSSESAALCL